MGQHLSCPTRRTGITDTAIRRTNPTNYPSTSPDCPVAVCSQVSTFHWVTESVMHTNERWSSGFRDFWARGTLWKGKIVRRTLSYRVSLFSPQSDGGNHKRSISRHNCRWWPFFSHQLPNASHNCDVLNFCLYWRQSSALPHSLTAPMCTPIGTTWYPGLESLDKGTE